MHTKYHYGRVINSSYQNKVAVLLTVLYSYRMIEPPQGPLDTIPKVNYPPILTQANYYATKQMINQILSEDQDYVSWKIKNLRTGGTMNTFVPSDLARYNPEEDSEMDGEINKVPKNMTFIKDIYNEKNKNELMEEMEEPIEELSYEEQFKLLVLNLDDEQNNRFEVFHRTSLSKTQVKKLGSMVCNQNIGENVRVFLQAIGKVFAGEIIELALDVRKKWFVGQMVCEFDKRKDIGNKLKKYLKKLTILVELNSTNGDSHASNDNDSNIDNMLEDDSVDEAESDEYFDDEVELMKEIQEGNKLLKSKENTAEVRKSLIDHYNKLVKRFNLLDVSMEKYNKSPILPEHIREAWRLYRLQSETYKFGQWRGQGERSGTMFR